MDRFLAASGGYHGPFSNSRLEDLALQLRERLGRVARAAFVFASADHAPHFADISETLRVDGHIVDVIGCTADGRIDGGVTTESASGLSVLAISCDAAEPVVLRGSSPACLPDSAANASILLANPFTFHLEDWIDHLNKSLPGLPCVGGLAGGGDQSTVGVFCNGEAVDAVVMPLTGRTSIHPVVSQGCRPIGEPLTVTAAEHNIVYTLGGQSAYRVLESAFETLSENEKCSARGNLFAGLAGTEYVEEFTPGDFLIKNILGADPGSGAVVIGGIPRIGQTLQYQIRDRSVALGDLDRAFTIPGETLEQAFGALLFPCVARRGGFFEANDSDAARFDKVLGGLPLTGFLCNGEIAPVRGHNALHSHTAAGAVLIEQPPSL
jgi:small ligand-binding sensory domain FIST